MITHEHIMPIPHHVPHPEPHRLIRPVDRHSLVSVVYDGNKMKEIYGDKWSYHVDKIAPEPPEIKILFAIQMGFMVSINQRMIDALIRQKEEETALGISPYGFANESLTEDNLQTISSAIGISVDEVTAILDRAPEGVVSTIIAAAKRKLE